MSHLILKEDIMDFYQFYTGACFDAYKFLGAHVEHAGVTFRTFAPAASHIALIGEFNHWEEYEMHRIHDGNFWECYVAHATPGQMYKYRIYQQDGTCIDHCDPYGFGMELRPNSASMIRDLGTYRFHDELWMKNRTVRKK